MEQAARKRAREEEEEEEEKEPPKLKLNRKRKRGEPHVKLKRRKRKKRKNLIPIYGNFYDYHTRACDDRRFMYLKREWFEGKDCLDVGCNVGMLTIAIAKKFSCKTMDGIDIDPGLVHRARRLLKTVGNFVESEANDNELSSEELLKRVSFSAGNFIIHVETPPAYDTLLCLDVTMWVHLNRGDDGLIRLFAKMRNLLRPGGVLILQPHKWSSYRRSHHFSKAMENVYNSIQLRPSVFKDILLDKVGFRSMEKITVGNEEGLTHPIFLLRN